MIPYGRQTIEDDDIQAVTEALKGDYLTTGPKIQEFEESFAHITGARHAVVCSNGTAALHLAALSLNLGPGDAVIVPSITFLATANMPRATGADIVFSDVNPETGLMEERHFEEALERCKSLRIKAVFPVHLTGHCTDTAAIKKIAEQKEIRIVLDACHALGGVQDGFPIGSCHYEDMATFSFHPVKTITMGEGGAITTNSESLAEKMRCLRHHGMKQKPDHGPWYHEMPELGYNYRATDFQCALGLMQLQKLNRFVEKRQKLATYYDELLKPLAPIVQTPLKDKNTKTGLHLYAVRIDFETLGISRSDLMLRLREKKIGTQVHYIPVHSQPYYRRCYGNIELPGADIYYERTLSLPLYPAMDKKDILYIVEVLTQLIGK